MDAIKDEMAEIVSRNDPPVTADIQELERRLDSHIAANTAYAFVGPLKAIKEDLDRLKWELARAMPANPGITFDEKWRGPTSCSLRDLDATLKMLLPQPSERSHHMAAGTPRDSTNTTKQSERSYDHKSERGVEKRMKTALRYITPIAEDSTDAMVMRWVIRMFRAIKSLEATQQKRDEDTIDCIVDHLLGILPKKRCKNVIPNPKIWDVIQGVYESIRKSNRRHALAGVEYDMGRELVDQPGDVLMEWAIDADQLSHTYDVPQVVNWTLQQPDRDRIVAVLKGVIPDQDNRVGRLEENKGESWDQFRERVEQWKAVKEAQKKPIPTNPLSAKRSRSPQLQNIEADKKNESRPVGAGRQGENESMLVMQRTPRKDKRTTQEEFYERNCRLPQCAKGPVHKIKDCKVKPPRNITTPIGRRRSRSREKRRRRSHSRERRPKRSRSPDRRQKSAERTKKPKEQSKRDRSRSRGRKEQDLKAFVEKITQEAQRFGARRD
jgi:hypothetical protein